MSDKPKFLSFQGAMYVRADQFVRAPKGMTFEGGMGREKIGKVFFEDGSWFEVGDNGYRAWPISEALAKVGVLGEEPEPIKMRLDLDVNEALEKIESLIARAELAKDLTSQITINAENFTVNGADLKSEVIAAIKKELQPGGILSQ